MTYRDLIYAADKMLENNTLTLGEYEEMTKPLDTEITKKGNWIYHSDAHHYLPYQCSVCKHFSNDNTHFCPNCGARMEGNEK